MIKFLMKAHQGIKGHVRDQNNNLLEDARIEIVEGVEIGKNIKTSERGEYWRILIPGEYKIKAYHKGYGSNIVKVKVQEDFVQVIDFIIDKSKSVP